MEHIGCDSLDGVCLVMVMKGKEGGFVNFFYFWGPGLRYVELDIAIENVREVLRFLGTQITGSTM